MTDNPHHLTPEEAKEKICPMIWHESCMADECMAWRWVSVPDDDENNPNGWVYSKTHGYCGKVPL